MVEPDRVTAALRELRTPLHHDVRTLHQAAQTVQSGPSAEAFAALDAALAYLREHFLPHCAAEEFTLLPTVDGVIGESGATNVMAEQHRVIEAMAADLAKAADASRSKNDPSAYAPVLIPLLYSLYGAIRLHLESEDAAYLDLLDDHLSESQADVLVQNLGRITRQQSAPAGL
ncbi:MAG: hypothetical protein Kow0010_16490 [Dehalococcoidia bacterium]